MWMTGCYMLLQFVWVHVRDSACLAFVWHRDSVVCFFVEGETAFLRVRFLAFLAGEGFDSGMDVRVLRELDARSERFVTACDVACEGFGMCSVRREKSKITVILK